jgi:hypothetical protein
MKMPNSPKIYLGLTTTSKSDWREKIEEIKKFNIEEIAVFTTALEPEQRQELYRLLKKTPVKYVPFTHLRHDSTEDEIDFFTEKYQTRLFNIHATPDTLLNFRLLNSKKKKMIYIENTDHLPEAFSPSLQEYAGICIDFAHLEDYGKLQKEESYKGFEELLGKYKVGYAHLSSVQKEKYFRHYEYNSFHDYHYSAHYLEKMTDLDYLKRYKDLFPPIMGIELENSLSEQIKMKKYIEEEILK